MAKPHGPKGESPPRRGCQPPKFALQAVKHQPNVPSVRLGTGPGLCGTVVAVRVVGLRRDPQHGRAAARPGGAEHSPRCPAPQKSPCDSAGVTWPPCWVVSEFQLRLGGTDGVATEDSVFRDLAEKPHRSPIKCLLRADPFPSLPWLPHAIVTTFLTSARVHRHPWPQIPSPGGTEHQAGALSQGRVSVGQGCPGFGLWPSPPLPGRGLQALCPEPAGVPAAPLPPAQRERLCPWGARSEGADRSELGSSSSSPPWQLV